MYIYKNLNNFRQKRDMGMGLVLFYNTHLKWLKFNALERNRTLEGTRTSAKVYGAWCTPIYSAMYQRNPRCQLNVNGVQVNHTTTCEWSIFIKMTCLICLAKLASYLVKKTTAAEQ